MLLNDSDEFVSISVNLLIYFTPNNINYLTFRIINVSIYCFTRM